MRLVTMTGPMKTNTERLKFQKKKGKRKVRDSDAAASAQKSQ
jgi:hypothetical protein